MWSLLPNSPQAPDCAICGVTLRLHQQMHGLALYAFKTEVDSVRWSALSRMHISTPCTASDTLLELVEFQQLPFLPPSPLFSFPRVCGAHPTLTPFCRSFEGGRAAAAQPAAAMGEPLAAAGGNGADTAASLRSVDRPAAAELFGAVRLDATTRTLPTSHAPKLQDGYDSDGPEVRREREHRRATALLLVLLARASWSLAAAAASRSRRSRAPLRASQSTCMLLAAALGAYYAYTLGAESETHILCDTPDQLCGLSK